MHCRSGMLARSLPRGIGEQFYKQKTVVVCVLIA